MKVELVKKEGKEECIRGVKRKLLHRASITLANFLLLVSREIVIWCKLMRRTTRLSLRL